MNFSAWSIKKPIPAILLFIILSILGIKSFRELGIQKFPDMEFPIITVSISLEGAAPSQLETEVTRKVENAVASLANVQHILSTVSNGSSFTLVEFDFGVNLQDALSSVNNAVTSIRGNLPTDINEPIIAKLTLGSAAIVTFSLSSMSKDEADLSWFADNELQKTILAVPGVGGYTRTGGVDRQVTIDLHPAQMAALGITTSMVTEAIKNTESDSSGGLGEIGHSLQSFRILGEVPNIDALKNLIISINSPSGNQHILLSDIAEIKDTIADRTSIALLDGKPIIAFSVKPTKGYSEVSVANDVRQAINTFTKKHTDIQIKEVVNSVDTITEDFKGSMTLLFEGAFLTVLVVWLFLRDSRATMLATIALPLSILPTFWAMKLFGFKLDTITLLALTLVVGILVDDAIVEIENIVRHLNMGKPPIQAATEAADEIGLAVIATSLSIAAVFLPTAAMSGVPGLIFKPFGLTAAAAVISSLLVARLLTPMMAAYLLKPAHEKTITDGLLMQNYMGWAQWCLSHRKTTIVVALLFFVSSLTLIPFIPTGFMAAENNDVTSVTLQLPPGSTLTDTLKATNDANQLLQGMTDITQIFSSVGAVSTGDGMVSFSSENVDSAMLTISLTKRSERTQTQTQIEQNLINRLSLLPAVKVSVGHNMGSQLQITLAGEDSELLDKTANQLMQQIRTLPQLGKVSSSANLQLEEIHIYPDFNAMAEQGVTTNSIGMAIRMATAGGFSSSLPKLNLPERQVPILIRLAPDVRKDMAQIAQLPITTTHGTLPLSALANIIMASGPSQISRLDRFRNITISIDLNGMALGSANTSVLNLPLLQHLPAGISLIKEGDAERQAELFGSFGSAMLFGILCIYFILVLLFHDFGQPITILVALPLSFGGALIAILISNSMLSMPTIIGLLMLIGIVSKNSILLVDYIVLAQRDLKMNRADALLDACHKRARPILMTTIAMCAGMLPIAMGMGADASFRQPMAITVIGGLITSTFLSLLVVPVTFSIVDDNKKWIKGLFIRK